MDFDLPCLLERAKYLNISSTNSFLGRTTNNDTKIDSFAKSKYIHISGRVPFDVFCEITKEHKLRSYTLNDVSIHFLNEKVEEMNLIEISSLWTGSDKDRS